ncbi:MAG: Cyclolysin [Candidatus Accumulibacter adjunctus]|uniref:Cyclolysin n=1 Tax=Candidatus Accumulibacter adjunctus TaxID=1454001 RepID=A0A011MNT8_9PROT|nr:MAG: Cyclolysin [Candidatus Accumulibacter adjunctus]
MTVQGAYTGTLDGGEKFQVSADGGSSWADATSVAGVWFATVTLSAGIGTLSTRTIDAAGNATGGVSRGYTLDQTVAAPSFSLQQDTGASSGDGVTKVGTLVVNSLEAGATWEYSTDGGTGWSTGTGTTFDLTANTTYAAGLIRVRQTDLADNLSAEASNSASITVDTVDPVAPSFSLVSDTGGNASDGYTSNDNISVSGVEGTATWQYSTNGGSTWTNGSASTFEIAEGAYAAGQIQVRQTDLAGNTGPVSTNGATITVDQTVAPPTFALAADTGGSGSDGITSNGLINVFGVEAGATWEYTTNSGGGWTTGTGSSFTLGGNATYAAGTVQVRQTDQAGNASSATSNGSPITVDTLNPIAVVSVISQIVDDTGTPGDFITSDGVVTVSGTFSGALGVGETIQVSANGGATWVTAGISSPVWVATDVALVNGSGTLTTRTVDTAGNAVSGASHSYVYSLVYTGTPGPDSLVGTAADEQFYGLAGNDTINGGGGTDTMYGGLGDDIYTVDSLADSVREEPGEGSDLVYSSVSWTLPDNVERLSLTGSAAVSATGNGLANTLSGQNNGAANALTGGAGDDAYYVGMGDSVNEAAGGGNDIVYSKISWTLSANVERLYLYGTTQGVTGTGNGLANKLHAHDNGFADTLVGGQGDDIYEVRSNDVIVELTSQGSDTANCYDNYTLAAGVSVENLLLYVTAAKTLTGNEFANYLRGNNGNDTLYGSLGNDTLNGATGADAMYGGQGNDVYTVDDAGDSVVEYSADGNDLVNSSVSWTLGDNIEQLTLTGSGAVNATGNELANTLSGRDNGAANVLTGRGGDDAYYVGANDSVVEVAGEGNDVVYSKISWTLGDNIERLYLYSTAQGVTGTGNGLANKLYGHDSAFADTLIGGAGNDTYEVRSNDSIVELAGEGSDVANCYDSYTLAAGVSVEYLFLYVTVGKTLNGNELANYLRGNNGGDTLNGNLGNDTLTGGLGNDLLTGGSGADIFRFDAALNSSTNLDTITDFIVPDDTIQLENAVFTSLPTTGALSAGSFVVGTAALDANDYVLYDSSTGGLFYDADGNGAGAAVKFATVAVGLALTNLDFVVT